MKKCLIIFTIAILSIIPISKASALVGNDGVEYPDIPDNNKYYLMVNRLGVIRLYTFDIEPYLISSNWNSNNTTTIYFYAYDIINNQSYTEVEPYNVNYYTLNGSSWTFNETINDYKDWASSSYILYSTMDVYYHNSIGATSIYGDGYYFIPGEKSSGDLTYISNTSKKTEYLTYSENKANDLDGIDIYNFRFNANNYNPSYKYLIKTEQQTEWTDITEDLNNEANQYDYMLYYNTNLYMQVLDENNEVLETKTHQITDLTEYSFKITHAPANDLNDRYINVITIDTRYIYEMDYKYQYSFDNQVFYDMEITEDNKIYYLNHALDIPVYFRVLNAGSIVIHEQVYNGDFSNVEKNVIFYESTNISNNEKQIIIQVDFTEYLKFFDIYNFRIWINNVEYDEQTFIKEFISTEENYIKSIKIKIAVDNLTIENFTYRVGTETGTSGGSDTDFDNMYETILDNQLKNELKENDYTTVNGMVQAIKNFINAISEFVTVFFELIMYFFNKLNIWIRTCIISLFIELVIFKTIKAVRKK